MGTGDVSHRSKAAGVAAWLTAGLLVAGAASPAATAGAASPAATAGAAAPAASPAPADGALFAVSATSAANAWAVGFRFGGQANRTLTEHWTGSAWKQVKSLSPGGVGHDAELRGVSALSRNNAWAVGFYSDGTLDHSLIEHWNGRAWKQFKAPVQGCTPGDVLSSVVAISPANVWAVGTVTNCFTLNGTPDAFHWNGKSWHEVPPPNPGQGLGGELQGVDATSAHNVWAVGDYPTGQAQGRLTMTAHWNGAKWKLIKNPSPTGATETNVLNGVSVASGSNAWAVGFSVKHSPHAAVTVALHWNGKAWTHVPSPHPAHGNGDALDGVAALSATNAFAVGSFRNTKNMVRDLALGWNGRTWNLVPVPTPPATKESSMSGVTATSDTNAWAVGFYSFGTAHKVIIVHWNGKSWHRQL